MMSPGYPYSPIIRAAFRRKSSGVTDIAAQDSDRPVPALAGDWCPAASAMAPKTQMAIVQARGHTIVDDPPHTAPPLPDGAISRADFDAKSSAEKRAIALSGQQIVDCEDLPV